MKAEQKPVEIPVVYATDQNYLFYTCVSITSLAENAAENTFYKVYILVSMELLDKESIIKKLNGRYSNIQINTILIDTKDFDNVFINNEHISKAAFYRLSICDSINENKCIYLDSDTIVMEDLQELWHLDIDNFYLAGCRDIWIEWLTEKECEERRIATNIPSMEDYVNSGILIFNIKKMRKDNINEFFLKHIKLRYPYEDQDILNVCCYKNIYKLSTKWNNFTAGIGYDEELRAAGVKDAVLNAFRSSQGITHYITKEARPWEGRLFWKNWYWWQMAEKWSDLTEYKKLYTYIRNKEKQNSWIEYMIKIKSYPTVVVWGFTKYAMELCDWIQIAQFNIHIYFCDRDKEKWGQSHHGVTVLSPEQALEMNNDCLYIVASQIRGEEIKADLLEKKVLETNILIYTRKGLHFYRMLDSRYYEQELEEIYIKEGISLSPEDRIRELSKHDDWIDKYYLKRWILKLERGNGDA